MTHRHNLDITLTCQDGERLAATLFEPELPAPPLGAVMLAPATGIKRQFYANFASFLATQGFAVLTFDNRGIGGSLHGRISASRAAIVDWGQQDMTAALEELKRRYPASCYHLIGHSAGGQLIGLMANHHHLSSMLAFASSSGSLRNMRWPFLLSAHYFMNLFMPLTTTLFGHAKNQWVGMGEPLPKRVAQQWRKWCNGEGYLKTEFANGLKHHCDDVCLPGLWINASDDHIANDANVADMLAVYPKLQAQRLQLIPSQHQLNDIGHMKFFSRQAQSLWPIALEWLLQHSHEQPQRQPA
ncbi:alpha/beta fold hydrolase [Ferrimonas senticii]|uniref:alpha/beta hydrolase family protein n=1 Tax=Ferrimonas senticii TaxID=394566 RepID=UPI00040DA62C|nr:alpha/beta fold hydrolase [Ferrimonas senticii]